MTVGAHFIASCRIISQRAAKSFTMLWKGCDQPKVSASGLPKNSRLHAGVSHHCTGVSHRYAGVSHCYAGVSHCYGWKHVPVRSTAEALAPRVSECDYVW